MPRALRSKCSAEAEFVVLRLLVVRVHFSGRILLSVPRCILSCSPLTSSSESEVNSHCREGRLLTRERFNRICLDESRGRTSLKVVSREGHCLGQCVVSISR